MTCLRIAAQSEVAHILKHSTLACLVFLISAAAVACRRDVGTFLVPVRAQSATGPLRVDHDNPRYFTDGSGKAIYLAGAHTWSNVQDRGSLNPPKVAFDYTAYVRWMVSHNFNFMRLWTAELPIGTDDLYENIVAPPWKWLRNGLSNANDGAPKFDLSRIDPNYYNRIRSRAIEAGNNGIYVSIMLFNGFQWQFETNPKDGNPFESSNNINGISCPSTCPTDNSQISDQAWNYEQAYIRKVVDMVNDLDNVLFEVSNEAGAPYSDLAV